MTTRENRNPLSDVELTTSGAPSPVPAKKRLRVYQNWQGNERFFCWGYLVAGPNWKASLGTAALISAPAGIYLAFVAPYMGLHVHAIILVISCILPVLSVWFLMLTACRDPGIIPRQEPDQEALSNQKPRTKEVYVNNQRVVIRYNDTCHFYQPPRAHHCSVNDNCIERFDHHCPWVGTTIGMRNYRTFLLFVYTSTVLCLYVFGVCVAMLFVKHNQLVEEARDAGQETSGLWGKAIGRCIPALVLMGYTFLFFWFVGGLSVFHAYLVATNQTTYENFRYNHDNRPNPYSRGILRNCAEVWCTPVPPSKVKFRAYVDEVTPPTGQPSSPYLNGTSWGGPDGGAEVQQEQHGGSDAGISGGGTPTGQGGMGGMPPHGMAPPHSPHLSYKPPLPQAQHSGNGGGAAYGYGAQGLGAAGAAYDPAALHSAAQTYGLPYGQGPQRSEGGGSYSDAGGGWAAGGGPNNEPPAQVRGYSTFTSQAGPGMAAAPSGGGSPRGGGGYGVGGGAAVRYPQAPAQQRGGGGDGYGGVDPRHHQHQAHVYDDDGGGQPYYGEEQDVYDEQDLYAEYDEDEEEGEGEEEHEEDGGHEYQGNQGVQHRGGPVRPEHVRPVMR